MSEYISERLRALVARRADHSCEYCWLAEEDAFHAFHLDHIISRKHGGDTKAENLAYACQFCNRNKGSDVGSVLPESREFVRFFNPRVDEWPDHFSIENGLLVGKTAIGVATVNILRFNEPELLMDRRLLIQAGRYPGLRP